MADFFIKQNDSGPSIMSTLQDADGVSVPLTGALVHFHLTSALGGEAVVEAVALILDEAAGTVQYDWQAGDTGTAGMFYADWRVTFPSGVVETFPNDSHVVIRILEQLA